LSLHLFVMNPWVHILRPLFLILFVSYAVYISPRLIFDDSLKSWVPPESEIIEDYKTFLEEFQSDAMIIVALVAPEGSGMDLFSASSDSIMDEISQLKHVKSVDPWPPPFLKYKTESPENIKAFFLTFIPPSHLNPNRPELVEELTKLLDSTQLEYHIAGTGVIHKAINDYTNHASKRYLFIGIGVLCILLVFFTRDPGTILKAMGISLGSVAWVIVAAWWFDIRINTVMSILPCLILFYSTSVSVHILNHQGKIEKVIWPTLIAVVTSCVGFSAFLLDQAPLLRDFGLLAIVGLLGGLFWAFVLFYPPGKTAPSAFPFKDKVGFIKKLWNSRVVVAGVVMAVVLLPGAIQVKSEIDTLSVLPRDHRTVLDYKFLEMHLGPNVPVEYRVDISQTSSKELMSWIEQVYEMDMIGGRDREDSEIPDWIRFGKKKH